MYFSLYLWNFVIKINEIFKIKLWTFLLVRDALSINSNELNRLWLLPKLQIAFLKKKVIHVYVTHSSTRKTEGQIIGQWTYKDKPSQYLLRFLLKLLRIFLNIFTPTKIFVENKWVFCWLKHINIENIPAIVPKQSLKKISL